jgi:Uma2 family endonuclease
MALAEHRPRLDAAAYLAWEAEQTERHEFVDGEVYAMTGARDAHNRVAGNLFVALKAALRGTPCRTFISDMKLHIASADAYVYPDVFVTCHEADRAPAADLMKHHPSLVVEVLSDSTGAYDRGRKFELYRSIAGLTEVLFVQADRPQVDLFRLNPADGLWVLHPASGLGARMPLNSLDIELPLAAVYDDVLDVASPAQDAGAG